MTSHEGEARALMARKAHRPASQWRVATAPRDGKIYDWADPATGKVGQCWADESGQWRQSPGGISPVVLEWNRKGWK